MCLNELKQCSTFFGPSQWTSILLGGVLWQTIPEKLNQEKRIKALQWIWVFESSLVTVHYVWL